MKLAELSPADIDSHIRHWHQRVKNARTLDERALALRVRDRWLDHRLDVMGRNPMRQQNHGATR